MTKITSERSILFDQLDFGYPGKKIIFEKMSLTLKAKHPGKGYVVALMGASGVGKSSLLNLILGVERPLAGSVAVHPRDAVISFLPQEPVLFEHLTPMQNAAYFSTTTAFKNNFDPQFFHKMSMELGMDTLLQRTKSVRQLSGGEKQRLMLLRALSVRPDILLLDEPTNGLDSEAKLRFLTLLREIVVQHQVLTVYCTHNKTECDLVADDILFVSSYPIKSQKVFHSSFRDFTAIPPTIEAHKAVNYPVANLLCCRLDKNQYLVPAKATDPDCFYVVLSDRHLSFGENGTIDYKISGFNPVYTQLTIEEQVINLPTAFIPIGNGQRLSLNGSLPTYHHDQSFAGVVHFVNSKLSSSHATV